MKTKYTIEIETGSQFQHDVWIKMLDMLLPTLKSDIESKHKKNKFNFSKS